MLRSYFLPVDIFVSLSHPNARRKEEERSLESENNDESTLPAPLLEGLVTMFLVNAYFCSTGSPTECHFRDIVINDSPELGQIVPAALKQL